MCRRDRGRYIGFELGVGGASLSLRLPGRAVALVSFFFLHGEDQVVLVLFLNFARGDWGGHASVQATTGAR